MLFKLKKGKYVQKTTEFKELIQNANLNEQWTITVIYQGKERKLIQNATRTFNVYLYAIEILNMEADDIVKMFNK